MRHPSSLNHPHRIALLVLGAALIVASPVAAEDAVSALNHHLGNARQARAANDWDTANAEFGLALRQAELLEQSDSRLVRALEEAARAYQHQKDGVRAIELQLRAVELQRARFTEPNNNIAESVYRLGKLYREFDDLQAAEAAFREALEIREGFEQRTARLTQMRRDLSNVIVELRSGDPEAEELLVHDLDQGDTASRREHLARYYARQEQHDASIEHYERSIEIERGLPLPSARRLVSMLTSLASEYQAVGRLGEAEDALLSAIELREDDMGPRHPYLAFTLRKLGQLYIEQERWLDAETVLLRARELNEAAWGQRDHECSCATADLLAQVQIALGRIDEPAPEVDFEPEPSRAVELVATGSTQGVEPAAEPEASRAETQIRSLDDRVRRLRASGEIETAKRLATEALELRREHYGPQSQETANGLDRLGRLWRDQRRYDEAADLYVERLGILSVLLEEDDPRLAAAHGLQGVLERDRGNRAEAELHLMTEVDLRERMGQRIEAARTLETLGSLNLTRQLPEKAEANFIRAVELWEDFAGTRAPEVVRNRARMVQAWLKLDRLEASEAALRELLELEQSKLYPDTSLLIQIVQPLEVVLKRTGRVEEAQVMRAWLDEMRALRQAALKGIAATAPHAQRTSVEMKRKGS